MAVFSPSEAVKTGWNITTKNFKLLLIGTLLLYLPGMLIGSISKDHESAVSGLRALVNIFSIWITVGYVQVVAKLLENGKPTWKDFFGSGQAFIRYIVSGLVMGLIFGALFGLSFGLYVVAIAGTYRSLMIVLGSIIILAGIYLAIRFSQVNYVAVLGDKWPLETFKRSWRMTAGNFWTLVGLGFLLIGINILGAIAILVGLLWTIPTSIVAGVYVYNKLK